MRNQKLIDASDVLCSADRTADVFRQSENRANSRNASVPDRYLRFGRSWVNLIHVPVSFFTLPVLAIVVIGVIDAQFCNVLCNRVEPLLGWCANLAFGRPRSFSGTVRNFWDALSVHGHMRVDAYAQCCLGEFCHYGLPVAAADVLGVAWGTLHTYYDRVL